MTGPFFGDSNVLIYCYDSATPEKQARASLWMDYLWRFRCGRLSVQVLQEFYVNVTQKAKPGLDRAKARQVIRDLTAWRAVVNNSFALLVAWDLQDRYELSLWDSLIVAAAHESSCQVLLTEDLQHGQDLGGVVVVNPFLETPPERKN
jgi:predicted nucleic acid-binding protein